MDGQKLFGGFLGSGGAAMLVACLLGTQVERAGAQTSQGTNVMFAYVGSFTTAQRKARGDGIHVYRVDAATGMWTHVQHIGDLTNPSFLALSPDQRFLYSVHGDGDYATAFMLNGETGQAKLLNRGATGGNNGVRQAVDPTGKFVIVANYGSGSVAVLPIAADGSLKDQHQLVTLPGEPGPHKVEQTRSHPHDIVFDPSGRFLLVPDKGLDRVFVFRFDGVNGRLSPAEQASVKTRPGAGPRHLAFHPKLPIAWVLNELDSTTATYRWDAERGTLTPIQVLPHCLRISPATAQRPKSRSRRTVALCIAPIVATTAWLCTPPMRETDCLPRLDGSSRKAASHASLASTRQGAFSTRPTS